MASVAQRLKVAVHHHLAGSLKSAEKEYREILRIDPQYSDALHLLGVIRHQERHHSTAVELISRAIALKPDSVRYHKTLGATFLEMGRLEEAEGSYRRAVTMNPSHAESWYHLGHILHRRLQIQEAASCFRRALQIQPNHLESRFELANALKTKGKLEEAIECYQEILASHSNLPEVHFHLGNVLRLSNRPQDAVGCYRRVMELQPESIKAINSLAITYQILSDHEKAAYYFQQVLKLRPDSVSTQNNLGNSLLQMERVEAAAVCFRKALKNNSDSLEARLSLSRLLHDRGNFKEATTGYRRILQTHPEDADVLTHLGNVLLDQQCVKDALDCYEQSLHINPEHPGAHYHRSLVRLLRGEYERGWKEFDWRWKARSIQPPTYDVPLWNGTPLPDGTILLTTERDVGDLFQFIRFASLVKERMKTVIVQCPYSLIPLLRSCPGIDSFVANDEPLPRFDVYSPLMSLPAILRTSLECLPRETPYLFARRDSADHWQDVLTFPGELRVGINWQNHPAQKKDHFRSIPLKAFAPLARIPGVRLVNLQQGSGLEQLDEWKSSLKIIDPGTRVNTDSDSFLETAAVIQNLDLVVSCDAAVAHLAGALGVPTFLAISSIPNWRWMLDRTDSPWYPGMRLFRQKSSGDWESVFTDIRQAIETMLESTGKALRAE